MEVTTLRAVRNASPKPRASIATNATRWCAGGARSRASMRSSRSRRAGNRNKGFARGAMQLAARFYRTNPVPPTLFAEGAHRCALAPLAGRGHRRNFDVRRLGEGDSPSAQIVESPLTQPRFADLSAWPSPRKRGEGTITAVTDELRSVRAVLLDLQLLRPRRLV